MTKLDAGIISPNILAYDECAEIIVALGIDSISEKSIKALQKALIDYQADLDRNKEIPRLSKTRNRFSKIIKSASAFKKSIEDLHQKDIDHISAANLPKNLDLSDKIPELEVLLGRVMEATEKALLTLPKDPGGPSKTHGPRKGLIIRLINIYEKETGRKSSIIYDAYNELYTGPLYKFIEAVFLATNIRLGKKFSLGEDIKSARKIKEGMGKDELKAFVS